MIERHSTTTTKPIKAYALISCLYKQGSALLAVVLAVLLFITGSIAPLSGHGCGSGFAYADSSVLDKDNLADGLYAIKADIIKLNRRDKSMSDNAINHTVRLNVSGGSYYITLDLKGLKIGNNFGYLSDLSYYNVGFTWDGSGNPKGLLCPVDVVDVQKDALGNPLTDEYNTGTGKPYPDLVRFPLVNKASDPDGDIPLQFRVPIMDAISPGSGTQDALIRLDWATVRLATEADFPRDAPPELSAAVNYVCKKTGVKLKAGQGVFPAKTSFAFTIVKKGAAYKRALGAVGVDKKSMHLYSLSAVDVDGHTVVPEGKFTLSIPLRNIPTSKVAAYRIAKDAAKTLLTSSAADGYDVITVNALGDYALVDKTTSLKATASKNTTTASQLVAPPTIKTEPEAAGQEAGSNEDKGTGASKDVGTSPLTTVATPDLATPQAASKTSALNIPLMLLEAAAILAIVVAVAIIIRLRRSIRSPQ